jgi:nanoRNase/pAp phosphatase (c-di-AMP/oligoRNAs hydrolase)
MTIRQLEGSEDLLAFLTALERRLAAVGQSSLAAEVARASRFSAGSPSEFMQEAKLALGHARAAGGSLTATEIEEIDDVVRQIDAAFARIGGA